MVSRHQHPAVGARVRMTGLMPNDPDPIPVGTEGTVESLYEFSDGSAQISVAWENGRTLMLLSDDPFAVLEGAPE